MYVGNNAKKQADRFMMENFLLSYTSSFITNSSDNTQTAKTARDNSLLKESPSSCATLISMVGQLHHFDSGVHWVCREVKYGRFLQKDRVFITPKFMKHKQRLFQFYSEFKKS